MKPLSGNTSKAAHVHVGIVRLLDKFAYGQTSPAAELLHAHMAAFRPNATDRDLRRYQALRDHLLTKLIAAPNGHKYKLKTLQRKYLRYQLTVRYRDRGETWENAWQLTSEYVSASQPFSQSTVKDSYAEIKKLLAEEGMKRFCWGLEYEFQIALYGEQEPPAGTLLHPDFLRDPSADQA